MVHKSVLVCILIDQYYITLWSAVVDATVSVKTEIELLLIDFSSYADGLLHSYVGAVVVRSYVGADGGVSYCAPDAVDVDDLRWSAASVGLRSLLFFLRRR